MAPKLAGVVDDLSTVEEAFRGLYIEDKEAGHFVLDADVESHPSVHGLKSALQKQKERNQKLSTRAALIDGLEDDDVKTIVERRKNGAKDDDHPKGKDLDTIVAKRIAEEVKKYEPIVAENTALKKEMRNLRLNTALSKVALEAGVLPDALDDALETSRRFFDIQENGKIVVLDDDGDPTGMKPEKFYADKFKTLKPYLYASKAGSGGGTPPSGNSGSGALSAEQLNELPPAERLRQHRAAQKASGK